jgi:membrane associated rhomboid family serine protease
MDRLLARLERTFLGRLAIERLTLILVVGMGAAFVLLRLRPELYEMLQLNTSRLTREPWRLVTYLFLPPNMSLLLVGFALYIFWMMGSALEQTWGAFKFNVFYFVGVLGTTAAAFLTGQSEGNFWLNTTVFFAFATLFPDYTFYLFFILPVRVKWLALVSAGLLGLSALRGDNGTRLAIVVAFANYFLFFGGHLLALARGQRVLMRQAARRTSSRSAPPRGITAAERACAICGAKQSEGADIRVCSCDKCGGKTRDLCLEHARNH